MEEDPLDRIDRQWVAGIVVKNPFLKGSPSESALDEPWNALAESAALVCRLRSWHPMAQRRSYRLERIEWAWTSDALVVRVTADWLD